MNTLRKATTLFLFLLTLPPLFAQTDGARLFDDLALVEKIDKELADRLPFFYNNSMVGGYFNTPSARMQKSGMVVFGGGSVPPYINYGLGLQAFDHVELSLNYRVFRGVLEKNFGHEGFGDDAERIGNIKVAALLPEDGFDYLPSVAIGANDFIGTKRFNSQYIVFTQEWRRQNVELTLGWAKGYMRRLFGGAAWTPFRQTGIPILEGISLFAEYDPTNYKKHAFEHPSGRSVKSRLNGGITFTGWNAIQVTASSVRGEKIAGVASFRYPLGTTEGFFPKVDDATVYSSPIDTEPLGVVRADKQLAHELTCAFSDQGLDVFAIYLAEEGKELWIKVINNRYREERVVHERITHLLAALTPSNIATVVIIIEADGVPCQSYRFRTADLQRFLSGATSQPEMRALTPLCEAQNHPRGDDSELIFRRHKPIWTFTFRPRLITFFGSAKGKFKYNIGLIASPEGYLFDEVYYKMQLGYAIKSSIQNLGVTDRINPSHLFNVRTDWIRYYQTNSVSFEEGYLQKSWNVGKGFYYRLATGYFESAYGGVANELLFYPVNCNWGVGLEEATVWKRRYEGFGFMKKVRKVKKNHDVVHKHFVGQQYFLDLYYTFRPLELDFKVSVGQFLAKDKGARFEVGRWFESGLRVSLWYTLTNAHDKVNSSIYHDKGFAFAIPLDVFLRQSSRTFVGYALSAWLRDSGARSDTGRPLFNTLYDERYNCN